MKRRKKRGWIWLIVLAVLAAAVVFGLRYLNRMASQTAELAAAGMQQSYTVERGDIETVVVADGTLAADDTVSVRVPDALVVEKVLVQAGEEVKEGQPIAQLDMDSIHAQMAALKKKLNSEDIALNSHGEYDSLVSPVKGRLKYLPVKEGDDVLTAMSRFGALAIVSTDGWMRLTIQTDEALILGNLIEVKWEGGGVKGTISRRTADGYIILVPDERAPYMEPAKVMDKEREIGSGTLYINMPMEIIGYGGTVKSLKYRVNDSVPDGREIVKVKNPTPSISFEQHYAARKLYAAQLEKLIAYADDPRILSAYDGIVSELSIKNGEATGKSDTAEKENTAYTLATGGATKMSISVDELDILKVTDGATAEISLEALQEETLTGRVTAISKIGKKNNSISVFPVELTLDPDERLLTGMNGSAKILIDRVENVLLIPVEAISEDELGAFVNQVREDGTSARVPITTGRSDGKVAEVTSGLAEGDVITYTIMIADFMAAATSGDAVEVTSGVTVATEG